MQDSDAPAELEAMNNVEDGVSDKVKKKRKDSKKTPKV